MATLDDVYAAGQQDLSAAGDLNRWQLPQNLLSRLITFDDPDNGCFFCVDRRFPFLFFDPFSKPSNKSFVEIDSVREVEDMMKQKELLLKQWAIRKLQNEG